MKYVENITKKRLDNSTNDGHNSIINSLHSRFVKPTSMVKRQGYEIHSMEYFSRVEASILACFGEQLPNFLPQSVLKRFICEKLDQIWVLVDVLISESVQQIYTTYY